jgi:hypothetical protein
MHWRGFISFIILLLQYLHVSSHGRGIWIARLEYKRTVILYFSVLYYLADNNCQDPRTGGEPYQHVTMWSFQAVYHVNILPLTVNKQHAHVNVDQTIQQTFLPLKAQTACCNKFSTSVYSTASKNGTH